MCAGWGMGHAQRNAQDLFNIAPKRPNWDLKRELDKKLSKLERKTQESIHTLIRASLIPAEQSRSVPEWWLAFAQDNVWRRRKASQTTLLAP